MKKIISALLIGLCPISFAADPSHNYTVKSNVIEFTQTDWELIYSVDAYNFFVRKDIKSINESQAEIHTMVEFSLPEGITYADLSINVKRIFNYGVMDCNYKVFNLLTDLFADKNNNVVFAQMYEMGEYKSEVSTPDTARNSAYLKVCSNRS